MSPLEQYIQERIEELKSDKFEISLSVGNRPRISELQAVLSKIEELEKPMGHTETVKEIFPDGSFEVYEAGDDTLQELNK